MRRSIVHNVCAVVRAKDDRKKERPVVPWYRKEKDEHPAATDAAAAAMKAAATTTVLRRLATAVVVEVLFLLHPSLLPSAFLSLTRIRSASRRLAGGLPSTVLMVVRPPPHPQLRRGRDAMGCRLVAVAAVVAGVATS
jgi:hypothetical protein